MLSYVKIAVGFCHAEMVAAGNVSTNTISLVASER